MKRIFYFLGATALLYGCVSELDTYSPESPQPAAAEEVKSAIPGEAYVCFNEETAALIENGAFNATKAGVGVESLERIIPDGGEFDARHHEAGLHRWYTVRYSKLVTATKAAEGLNGMEGAESVVFPREKKLCGTSPFNDMYFYYQWSLYNDGSLTSSKRKTQYVEGCDINVLPVWEQYTAGSKDVIVSVIDGGADPDNEDLKDVIIAPGKHGSQTFVNGYEGYELYPFDHGCHVSGIIGGAGNNSYGIAGVAGGKDGKGGVKILSCGIFMTDPSDKDKTLHASDANIMQAFVHSADEGAVISNNSWGYTLESQKEAEKFMKEFNTGSSPVKTGIDYFVKYAGYDKDGNQTGPMAGGLVVWSADNTGFTAAAPAGYEKVMAVGAHGAKFNYSSYSAYGDWVDIVAPGGDYVNGEDQQPYEMIIGLSTGNDFVFMEGTSQAAPHVSGVAALLVSYLGGPGLTADMVWGYLVNGARRGVLSGNMSGPMLDAEGAFRCAEGKAEEIKILTSYRGDYSVKSHASFDVSFEILYNENRQLPVTLETDCKAVSYTATTSSLDLTVEALKDEPGTYPVCIYVGKGTSDEVSMSFDITILPNHAPTAVNQMTDICFNIEKASGSGSALNLQDYFTDSDEEALTYDIKTSSSGVAEVKLSEDVVKVSPVDYGTVSITITASDARGESCSQTFTVVCRDASREFDLYPNPVHDVLYVRSGEQRATKVEILNASGKVVLSAEQTTSPFKPVALDVSSLAPGSYTARVCIVNKLAGEVKVVKI